MPRSPWDPDHDLSGIVEHARDAIYTKDLHGIITSWNHGAEAVYGYTAEEMLGESIERLCPFDRKDEEHWILGRIAAGEAVEGFLTVRVRKNGQKINVLLTASPLRDASGHITGASSIAKDVTPRIKERQREGVRHLVSYVLVALAAVFGFWKVQANGDAVKHESAESSYRNCLSDQRNHDALVRLIDKAYSPQPIPASLPADLRNLFIEAQAKLPVQRQQVLATIGPRPACSHPKR